MSDFIPNSFQLPNVLVDRLMSELNPKEFVCLVLIIRKTRGWHKSADRIAISQFQKYTGINRVKTIQAAIEGLRRRGFVKVIKSRGCVNEYELTSLFSSGNIATSGKIASGKNPVDNSENQWQKRHPTKDIYKKQGARARVDQKGKQKRLDIDAIAERSRQQFLAEWEQRENELQGE